MDRMNSLRDFGSVESGHDNVHQEDRDRAVLGFGGDLQSCITALSREDLVSETRQPIAYSFENAESSSTTRMVITRGACHRQSPNTRQPIIGCTG